jgi:hypothetical protein
MSSSDALERSGARRCAVDPNAPSEAPDLQQTRTPNAGGVSETSAGTFAMSLDIEVINTDARDLTPQGSWQVRTRRVPM